MSETTTTAVANATHSRFDGDGAPYKGKLIGMEDLLVDRDERVCLDSMFKLKAVVIARGEHKQKIQLNLTINAIQVYDDTTKVLLASHEINRVTFVVLDPLDPRAFGYIYITSDNRFQFWAIKTERSAATTVLALKELFELAFERSKNSVKTEEQAYETMPLPVSTEDVSISLQKPSSDSIPVSKPQPPIPPPTAIPRPEQVPVTARFDNIWGDNPLPTVPQPLQVPVTPRTDNIWGDNPLPTVPQPLQTSQQQSTPNIDLWNFNEPIVPAIQPPPRAVDPLADVFDLLAPPPSVPTTTSQSVSTVGTSDLFSMFPTPTPTPTINTNLFAQPTQQTPFVPQRPPVSATPLVPQQQPNILGSMLSPSVAPKPATSPFGEFDLLGDFS